MAALQTSFALTLLALRSPVEGEQRYSMLKTHSGQGGGRIVFGIYSVTRNFATQVTILCNIKRGNINTTLIN